METSFYITIKFRHVAFIVEISPILLSWACVLKSKGRGEAQVNDNFDVTLQQKHRQSPFSPLTTLAMGFLVTSFIHILKLLWNFVFIIKTNRLSTDNREKVGNNVIDILQISKISQQVKDVISYDF